jgi:hypothetical protein
MGGGLASGEGRGMVVALAAVDRVRLFSNRSWLKDLKRRR